MSLINCKVKFKFKWKKDCVLSVASTKNDVNDNNNANNIIFAIKGTKLYAPAVTIKIYQNFLAKDRKIHLLE